MEFIPPPLKIYSSNIELAPTSTQWKTLRTTRQNTITTLNTPILVMSTHSVNINILIGLINLIYKRFSRKNAIISMVRPNSDPKAICV